MDASHRPFREQSPSNLHEGRKVLLTLIVVLETTNSATFSYFFSLVGSSVKIHSVITGQVVSTLSAPRSTDSGASSDTLTTAILNPHNAFQLITGSLDGRLVVWDFLDAALLQIIDIAQPILYICAHNSLKDVVFVGASRPAKKQKSSGTGAFEFPSKSINIFDLISICRRQCSRTSRLSQAFWYHHQVSRYTSDWQNSLSNWSYLFTERRMACCYGWP